MSTAVRNKAYDMVVIGGGTGGLSAALEAARRNASVLLVQEGRLGGDCTFTGCVPSKALLAAAARGQSFKEASAEVHRAIETVAAAEDDDALGAEGVEVLHGRAVFRSPQEVDVDGRRVRSSRFVATGAAPLVPPIEGLSEIHPLTNENLFDLDELPPRLAVLGGGPIGAEMSQAFARLGSSVTLLEAGDRILAKEEPEASEVVAEALRHDGVQVRTGSKVVKAEATDGNRATRVHVDGAEPVEVDRLLVAIGRRPSTSGMGLEDAGVELDDRGFIGTDHTMATSVPGIWAVGDVAGSLQFTHAANRMATVAVSNALSPWLKARKRRFDTQQLPWATFTSPEVGRVGMTEAQAADHGGRVAYLPMTEVDRAVATGQTRGFIKLMAGPRPVLRGLGGGRLLGATAVATVGGELVHEVALAMRTNMFTGRLAQTVHAYPTWSLAVQQAAAQFFFQIGGREARPARR
ncbi:MAG TPA: FAD-dependent oxidoreductase [Acidimicrobiales bacterium]|nr:FAD-dependent oxidoreductase [Acidimicrobiales bacterium]